MTIVLANTQNDNLIRWVMDKAFIECQCLFQLAIEALFFRMDSKRVDIRANKNTAKNRKRNPGMMGRTRPMRPITTQQAIAAMHSPFNKKGIG